MSKLEKPALTLKQFILKQEVKHLYRRIFRAIKKVEDQNHQEELKQWARTDFRSNAHHTDEVTIKMLLKYGEQCLQQLEINLSLAK